MPAGKEERDGFASPFLTGGWRVEPARCVIIRDSQEIRLQPKVMDVLVCLARRTNEVVSKDELIREVWEGSFVSDEVISVSVFELRKALGDSARNPRWVETIPRRGYRWLHPVIVDGGNRLPEEPQEPQARSRVPARLLIEAAVMLIVLLAAIWIRWIQAKEPGEAAPLHPEEAVVAYQKGEHFLSHCPPDGPRQALAHFEQAVHADPHYAEAYSGVAQASVTLAELGLGDQRELHLQARAAAEHALALDGDLAEAHAALGLVRLLVDWDFPRAEESMRRAIALNPNSLNAHRFYAKLLSASERHEQAIAEAHRAIVLNPTAPIRYEELAWALYYAGRGGEALAQLDKALELDPNYFRAYFFKGAILLQAGEPQAAFKSYRAGYSHEGREADGDKYVGPLEQAYDKGGIAGVYGLWLEGARKASNLKIPQSQVGLAQLYARLGETDQALQALERAYEKHEAKLIWLKVDPMLLPLHQQARFQTLARKVQPNG